MKLDSQTYHFIRWCTADSSNGIGRNGSSKNGSSNGVAQSAEPEPGWDAFDLSGDGWWDASNDWAGQRTASEWGDFEARSVDAPNGYEASAQGQVDDPAGQANGTTFSDSNGTHFEESTSRYFDESNANGYHRTWNPGPGTAQQESKSDITHLTQKEKVSRDSKSVQLKRACFAQSSSQFFLIY